MTEEQTQGMVAALYGTLTDAEAALNALLAAGVPYERIRLGAHRVEDPLRAAVPVDLPESFWSLAIRPGDDDPTRLQEHLREHRPLVIGRLRAPTIERSDGERGMMAWGHIVFESPASTNQQPEAAGTSGTTGVVNSGAFADGARVQKT